MSDFLVALYGSVARGDTDSDSDVDVLVVADDDCTVNLSEPFVDAAVSRYSWSEVRSMHRYGSLFLQHLRMEAKILDASERGRSDFDSLLRTLPTYARAEQDIASFIVAIDDAADSVASGDANLNFELSSIATVLRHTAIVGCFLIGLPNFGRYSAVASFCDARGLPSAIGREFPALYRYKRKWTFDLADAGYSDEQGEFVTTWITRARTVIGEVEKCRQMIGVGSAS